MAARGIDELFGEWYSKFYQGTYIEPSKNKNEVSNNTLLEPDARPTESNNTDLSRNEQLTIVQLQSVQFAQQTTHE